MYRLRSSADVVFLLLAALLVLPASCPADDGLDDSLLREILDGLAEEGSSVEGLEELLREAAAFRENPVDVNSAGLSELLRVPFLDPASAVRIVARRDSLGPAGTLDELVERGCLGRETLRVVRPYLAAGPAAPGREVGPGDAASEPGAEERVSPVAWELRLRATTRESWEDSWGGRDALGSVGTFARLRVAHANGLDLSLACEKDVGESSLLDHSVLSLSWRGTDGVAPPGSGTAVSFGVGDFVGSWGQGLVVRSGGFPSETAYPRRRDSVRRYDGAGESSARRGAFVVASRGRARVHVLLARTAFDAAVDDEGLVTSIRTTGYHRTEGETEGASRLQESLAGVRVSFKQIGGLELSASALRVAYSPALAPGDPFRQRFKFSGEELTAGGLDARLSVGDLSAGFEAASTSAGGPAVLAAARLKRGNARLTAGAGYLSPDYWSPLGGGVPGYSGGSNGAVGWIRADYRSDSGWKAWASTRVTRRPWRSYLSEMPDGSSSVTAGGEFRSRKSLRLSLDSRVTSRSVSDGDLAVTAGVASRRVRVTLRTAGDAPIQVSAWRVDALTDGSEAGSLLAASLRVSGVIGVGAPTMRASHRRPGAGSAPASVQYEPRLPGEFGLASLNAPGTRWYIRIQTGLPGGWGLSVRLSGGPERGQMRFGVGLDARG